MANYKFNAPKNVMYKTDNGTENYAIIFSRKILDGKPVYLVYNIETKGTANNVQEERLKECTIDKIVDYFWNKITYTGNNSEMSSYIIGKILKAICTQSKITWGPNSDNTEYNFNIEGFPTWIKIK